MNIKKHLIGDTIQITMINSGVTPSAALAKVYDSAETLVGSGTMTTSGNGHYFYNFTIPNSTGYYVAETLATINGLPYKNRRKFKVVTGEVD